MRGAPMQSRTARAVAIVLAIVSWSTLALQLYLTVNANVANGNGVLTGVVRNFSFFTVLTNTLAAVVLTAAIMSSGASSWWSSASVRGATAACMTMVGIVYTLVLRATWDPQGLQKVADVVLHDLMPVLFVACWLVYWRTGTLGPSHVSSWLAYPLTYLGYCLVHGAIAGWYPYAFLDVSALGYPRVFTIAAGITVAFSVLCLIVVAIDRMRAQPVQTLAP